MDGRADVDWATTVDGRIITIVYQAAANGRRKNLRAYGIWSSDRAAAIPDIIDISDGSDDYFSKHFRDWFEFEVGCAFNLLFPQKAGD